MPAEIPVWEDFLRTNFAKSFERFEYDVKVGRIPPAPETWPQWLKELLRTLWSKRIDAVGYRKNEIWIFEVKVLCRHTGLAQAQVYRYCLGRDKYPGREIKACVVARQFDPDIIELASILNIHLFSV